jgi:hypothetical protein
MSRAVLTRAPRRRSVIGALAVAAIGFGFAAQAGLKPSSTASGTPTASFSLEAPAFAGVTPRAVVSKDTKGVTRERLSYGLPLDPAADFTVVFTRGEAITQAPRVRADLKVLGPIGDLPVTVMGQSRMLTARLGAVEVVSLSLGTGAGRKSCLGFVAPLAKARDAGLTGWYCAALGKSAEDATLIDLIDHLRPRADGEFAAAAGHPLG